MNTILHHVSRDFEKKMPGCIAIFREGKTFIIPGDKAVAIACITDSPVQDNGYVYTSFDIENAIDKILLIYQAGYYVGVFDEAPKEQTEFYERLARSLSASGNDRGRNG